MPALPGGGARPPSSHRTSTPLTSSAWVDLSAEPLVLSLPDTGGRYYAMPMYDAWTTVFGTLGRADHRNQRRWTWCSCHRAGAAGCRGSCTSCSHRRPTPGSWDTSARTGRGTTPAVRRLQEQIRLTPLSRWPGDPGPRSRPPRSPRPLDARRRRPRSRGWTRREYFARVASAAHRRPAAPHRPRPPAPAGGARRRRRPPPGVVARRPPTGPGDRPWHGRGARPGGGRRRRAGLGQRAWTSPADLLRRQSEPLQRAALAWTGLGAWPRRGRPLLHHPGRRRGRPPDGAAAATCSASHPAPTPPARAFWSLTVHDGDGLAGEHRCRLAVGDRDPLWRAPDGSLTIHLSADPPRSDAANWLPTPPGPFGLALRLLLARAVGPRRQLVAARRWTWPGKPQVGAVVPPAAAG